jgi:hypothetical protein
MHSGLKQLQMCKRSYSTGHVHIKIVTLLLFVIAWIYTSVKILNYIWANSIRVCFYLLLNVLATSCYVFHMYHTKFCWELMDWIILAEDGGNCIHGNKQLIIDFVIHIPAYTLYKYIILQHAAIFVTEMNLRYSQNIGNFFTSWGTIIFSRSNFLSCMQLIPLRNFDFILHIRSFINSKFGGETFCSSDKASDVYSVFPISNLGRTPTPWLMSAVGFLCPPGKFRNNTSN